MVILGMGNKDRYSTRSKRINNNNNNNNFVCSVDDGVKVTHLLQYHSLNQQEGLLGASCDVMDKSSDYFSRI